MDRVGAVLCVRMAFVAAKGTVRAIRDVNLRVGAPSLTAKTKAAVKNAVFPVTGFVTDGDTVGDNTKWYKTVGGDFVWSGNVEFTAIQAAKILRAPLKSLICTQRFGLRPEVYKKFGSPKGHNGLDFRTRVGKSWKQPVYAVLAGTVSESGFDPLFKGNWVRITHPNGYESVYLHLDSRAVAVKEVVAAGQQIGVSGNTGGASEAPHLHFGYRPTKCNKADGYMGYIDPAGAFIDEVVFV